MRKLKLIIFFILNGIFLSACNSAEPRDERVKGLYFRYEGAEYESALVQCLDERIWRVEGGEAFKELVNLYKSSAHSRYGELFIEATGRFSPIDKTQFPNSHYVGVFRITGMINHSTDAQIIAECRKI